MSMNCVIFNIFKVKWLYEYKYKDLGIKYVFSLMIQFLYILCACIFWKLNNLRQFVLITKAEKYNILKKLHLCLKSYI